MVLLHKRFYIVILSEAKFLYCIVFFVIFGFRTFVIRFPYLVILSIHKNAKKTL